MSTVFATAGVLLLVTAAVDALWTTLWVDRAAGPLTARITSLAWRSALRLVGRRHTVLGAFGPLLLLGTVLLWVAMLWAGWVLVFAADPQSLLWTRGPGHADWTGRIWFVGYALFTMGNGDYTPQEGLWQVVSALVNASGMFLVTLAITYLLSVLSAVTNKRAFASSVHGLGRTGTGFVLAGWNGRDLHPLDRQLTQLSGQLVQVTEQYLAYPVLQYFHAARAEKSPALAVAVLDDALLLLRFAVSPALRPDPAATTAAWSSVGTFLETLEPAFIPTAPVPPPLPDVAPLPSSGVPVVDDGEFAAAVEGVTERRRRILGLVRNDGWDWREDAR